MKLQLGYRYPKTQSTHLSARVTESSSGLVPNFAFFSEQVVTRKVRDNHPMEGR